MRGSAVILGLALTLAVAGCSRPAAHTATAAAPPPAASPTAAAPAALAPATEPAAAVPAAPAAGAPAPGSPVFVRFSPGGYPAQERRVAALIANAETRDTTGETQYRANQGRAERQRCTTKACIERSYAVEEAWMRKWEGSGEVK
jgi:hypothetical protein